MSRKIGHSITSQTRHCADCGLEQEAGRKKPAPQRPHQTYHSAIDVSVPIDRYLSDVDRMVDLCLGCMAERRLEGERLSRFSTFDEHED